MNVCRICLKSENLICLFRSQNAKLPNKIMSCASVSIMFGDNLPSQICTKCIERLNTSYDFKILCERSDWILRRNVQNDPIDYASQFGVKKEEDSSIDPQSEIKSEDRCSVFPNDFNDPPHFIDVNPIFALKQSENGIEKPNKNNKTRNTRKKKKSGKDSPLLDDDFSSSDDIDREGNQSDSALDEIASQHFPLKKRHKILNKKGFKLDEKKTNKSDKTQKEQCVTCGKVMSSRFRLKMHMRIHTGEKPFSCSYCNKTFSLAQNLKVHQRVHTGEKPLLCGNCGKGFAQSSALIAHMRLHTGETPYKCTLCPMSFRTPGHLQYHIKQHTGEKNFECKICHKAFIAKGDLTQHTKTHTGERPFICTICGLRMSRSSHLTRHMITHTGEKPHSCNSCGSSYAQKGDLARHIKRFRDGSCRIADSISIRRWNEICDKKKPPENCGSNNDVNIKVENSATITNNMNL